MKHLITALALLGMLGLCGCPPPAKQQSNTTKPSSSAVVQVPDMRIPHAGGQPLHIALLASDMGLGDGAFVRELDSMLSSRSADGSFKYSLVGTLPREIQSGEITAEVGFPSAVSEFPGTMTDLQADAMLESVPACDWLVITSGYVLPFALNRIAAGSLEAGAVILVDEAGAPPMPDTASVPVYRLKFDIRHAAFMAGAAAARSNNHSHFVLLGAADDPQVDEFMEAAKAGLRYVSQGVWVLEEVLPVDSRGMVEPDVFRQKHVDMLKAAGENFVNNHYILDLTRSNPYVLNLIANPTGPINGYATLGYADIRAEAESRVITCALKRPSVALAWLIDNTVEPGAANASPGGYLEFGLRGTRPGQTESAIGYTDLERYSRFNYDGGEIDKDLATWWGEIEAGEIGLDY